MKNILFLTFAIITLITSCSTEDSGNDENNIIENTTNLVKRQYYDLLEDDGGFQRNNIEYSYNQNKLLSKVHDYTTQEEDGVIYAEFTKKHAFNYDSNNNIIEWVYERYIPLEDGLDNFIRKYEYDSKNRLITSYEYQTQTYTYSYNDNIITINDSDNSKTTLVTNADGLVSKMITPDYYSVFSYDENQNILEINTFDNNENILAAYKYTYDQNPNSFYGQLNSIYLSRFLIVMRSVWGGDPSHTEFVFQANINSGVDFPFLKNNLKSGIEDKFEDYIFKFNCDYEYNKENYPISILVNYNYWNTTINFEYFD